MACRFKETDCRELGRMTRGVRGMELRNEKGELATRLVSMTVVNPEAELLVVTAKGMGKRSRVGFGIAEKDAAISGGGYRLTRRGGKGVISIRLRDGDRVVQAIQLEQDEDLLLTSVKAQVVRISTQGIRTLGRNSIGVRVMRLREDDEISVVTKVAHLQDEAPEEGVVRDELPPDEGTDLAEEAAPETEVIEDVDEGAPVDDDDVPAEASADDSDEDEADGGDPAPAP